MNNDSLTTLVARAASCRAAWAYDALLTALLRAENRDYQSTVERLPTGLLIDLAGHMALRVSEPFPGRMAYLRAVRSSLARSRRQRVLPLEAAK